MTTSNALSSTTKTKKHHYRDEPDDLVIHYKDATGKPYCTTCKRDFTSEYCYLQHAAFVHFKCPFIARRNKISNTERRYKQLKGKKLPHSHKKYLSRAYMKHHGKMQDISDFESSSSEDDHIPNRRSITSGKQNNSSKSISDPSSDDIPNTERHSITFGKQNRIISDDEHSDDNNVSDILVTKSSRIIPGKRSRIISVSDDEHSDDNNVSDILVTKSSRIIPGKRSRIISVSDDEHSDDDVFQTISDDITDVIVTKSALKNKKSEMRSIKKKLICKLEKVTAKRDKIGSKTSKEEMLTSDSVQVSSLNRSLSQFEDQAIVISSDTDTDSVDTDTDSVDTDTDSVDTDTDSVDTDTDSVETVVSPSFGEVLDKIPVATSKRHKKPTLSQRTNEVILISDSDGYSVDTDTDSVETVVSPSFGEVLAKIPVATSKRHKKSTSSQRTDEVILISDSNGSSKAGPAVSKKLHTNTFETRKKKKTRRDSKRSSVDRQVFANEDTSIQPAQNADSTSGYCKECDKTFEPSFLYDVHAFFKHAHRKSLDCPVCVDYNSTSKEDFIQHVDSKKHKQAIQQYNLKQSVPISSEAIKQEIVETPSSPNKTGSKKHVPKKKKSDNVVYAYKQHITSVIFDRISKAKSQGLKKEYPPEKEDSVTEDHRIKKITFPDLPPEKNDETELPYTTGVPEKSSSEENIHRVSPDKAAVYQWLHSDAQDMTYKSDPSPHLACNPDGFKKCSICNKILRTYDDYMKHLLVQHHFHVVICPFCKIPFYTLNEHTSHMKDQHSEMYQSAIDLVMPPSQHTTQCTMCQKNFSKMSIGFHWILVHNAPQCPWCFVPIRNEEELVHHLSSHHGNIFVV